jgi:hypothetical protein
MESELLASLIVPATGPQNQQLAPPRRLGQMAPAPSIMPILSSSTLPAPPRSSPSSSDMMTNMSPLLPYISSPEEDIDLSEYADLFGMASDAHMEGRMIAPMNITTQLNQDATGRISQTNIVPANLTGGAAPRVITNAEYQSRVNGGSAFRFLPTQFNVPYKAYLNRALWYQLNDTKWAYEEDVTKHPDFEGWEEAKRREDRYNSRTFNLKDQSKKYGLKTNQGKNTYAKPTGSWDSKATAWYLDPKKDKDQSVAFNLTRPFGAVDAAALQEITVPAPPENKRNPGSLVNEVMDRVRFVQEVIEALNPEGLEMGQEGSRANDFYRDTQLDDGLTLLDETLRNYKELQRAQQLEYHTRLFEQNAIKEGWNISVPGPISEWDEPFVPTKNKSYYKRRSPHPLLIPSPKKKK